MVEHATFSTEDEEPPIIYVTEVLVEEPSYEYTDASMRFHSSEWACPTCTLLNSAHTQCCDACENPGPVVYSHHLNPTPTSASFEEEGKHPVKIPGASYHGNGVCQETEVEEVVDLGESPWAKKMRRRRRRKGRVCAGAVGGAIVGGVLGCGIGAFAGAVAGGMVARRFSKRGERKKDEQLAQQRLLHSVDETPETD